MTAKFYIHFGKDQEPRQTIEVEGRDKPTKSMGTATGYGRNMASNTQVKVNGKWRRVRMTCYSNAATFFIGRMGKEYHIVTIAY